MTATLYRYRAGVPEGTARPFHGGEDIRFSTVGVTKPTAATTGVLPGSMLTPNYGDIVVEDENESLENVDLHGRLLIRAPGFRGYNCNVRGGASIETGGLVDCVPAGWDDALFMHFTLAPDVRGPGWTGIFGHDYIAYRCDVSGTDDGFGVIPPPGGDGSEPCGVQILSSFVHDLQFWTPDPSHVDNKTHNDGIQVHGGSGFELRGSNIEMTFTDHNGVGGTPRSVDDGDGVNFTPLTGPIADALVERNWFDYGAAGVRGAGTTDVLTVQAVVRNNRFGPNFNLRDTLVPGVTAQRPMSFNIGYTNIADLPGETGTDLVAGNVRYDGSPALVWRQ